MPHDLPSTIADASNALSSKSMSSEELTSAYLERIHARDSSYNAFISTCDELALDQARAADKRRIAGEAGPVTGIPYANKDIFCTEGIRTTCGSRMLDNFVAPYTATAVSKLHDAGMVMLGKTNMDEFAMGSSNETSFYGAVNNPWDRNRVPGGSSGGSAAAVAARLAPCATGTDTGGSIRQPASLCGISGLKPTYGRVSRYGMIAFASSLDQGGPMAHTAEDLAIMLNHMVGHDARDSTSVNRPEEDFQATLGRSLDGLRIGLPDEFFTEQLDPAVADLIDAARRELESAGAICRQISLPHAGLAIPAYYVVASSECSSNLSRYDGVRFGYRCDDPKDLDDLYYRSRSEGFGREVMRRILVGTYALSAGYYDAFYRKAQQIRRLIQQDFAAAFDAIDVVLGPTSPSVAFGIGEKLNDPVEMYLSDIYTTAANLAGLPALSVPAGFVNGMPVGMQLIGNFFAEAKLLNVAHQYQLTTDWHRAMPEGCE